MAVELSILVATVPSLRASLLSRLLAVLEPQLDDRRVEAIVHTSETKPMGTKFNELYRAANGRLAVQVDDDDLVADDFVDEILFASAGHDFVGYRVDVTVNGHWEGRVTYDIDPARAGSLAPYDPHDLVRHVTPKCPLETALARRHPFGNAFGADWFWSRDLVTGGYPFNPVFIPRSLYWYDSWPGCSLGTRPSEWTQQREVPLMPFDRHRFEWIDR